MTIFFTSNQIRVYRNRKVSGKDQYGMSATGTVIAADIQPASDQRTESLGGRFGATFIGFVDTTADVKEGDKIKITDTGKIYLIKGVANWSGAGLLDYKELALSSQDG